MTANLNAPISHIPNVKQLVMTCVGHSPQRSKLDLSFRSTWLCYEVCCGLYDDHWMCEAFIFTENMFDRCDRILL